MDSCVLGLKSRRRSTKGIDRSSEIVAEHRDKPIERDELVLQHLALVKLVAQRFCQKLPPQVELDDLMSVGIIGLLDAAKRFDWSRSVQFRTYAETRVRGAIVDYLRSLSWAPRTLHRRARALETARSAFEQREGRSASLGELADELGIDTADCDRLLAEIRRLDVADIDSLTGDESKPQPLQLDDPEARLVRQEALELISKAVELLPERQKLVLWLYYCQELTMKEVGAALKVNEPRASQLHSKALAAVRTEVARLAALPARIGKKEVLAECR